MTSDSFRHLWDGTDEGWVLVRSRRSLPAIYNRVTRTALIIDDDEVYEEVVQEMLDHGIELFERLPLCSSSNHPWGILSQRRQPWR